MRLFLVLLLALALSAAAVSPAQAQIPDTFTNLKVLPKNISRQQLVAVMRDFTFALGVRCEHCHAEDVKGKGEPGSLTRLKFSSDEKAEKKTARVMMKMVGDLNGKYLADLPTSEEEHEHAHAEGAAHGHEHVEVRCVTCHRGQPRPRMLEEVLNETIAASGVAGGIAKYQELKQKFYGSFSYDFRDRPLIVVAGKLRTDKRPADAIQILQLAAQEHPESGQVQFMLGENYLDTGDKPHALESYKRVLTINPNNEEAKKRVEELSK